MQIIPVREPRLSSFQFGSGRITGSTNRPAPQATPDHRFVAMLDAYRGSGGLARGPELLGMFRHRGVSDVATLARWIVEREVICFEWHLQTWFPLFQFGGTEFAPDRRLGPIMLELTCLLEPVELAYWFASPNPELAERTPVDLLQSDLPGVLRAARSLRLASGAAAAQWFCSCPRPARRPGSTPGIQTTGSGAR